MLDILKALEKISKNKRYSDIARLTKNRQKRKQKRNKNNACPVFAISKYKIKRKRNYKRRRFLSDSDSD